MAARFWIGGGTNSNWNASPTTNWCATSGGIIRVAPPTASDDVTFDGVGVTANSASTISANITVLSLTFSSGYTNTITINTAVVLTVAGNFTDVTNHSWTVSGTGSMAISATSTIASGGKTFPGPVTFSGASATKTLNGDWTITGALTVATNAQVINFTTAEVLSCAGITMNAAATGTATIKLTGGTWSGGSTLSVNTNLQGNVTISGTPTFWTATLTYVSGTITTTGSTVTFGNSSTTTTLNTAGVIWNNIIFNGSLVTISLSSLLTVTGTFTIQQAITFSGVAGWTVGTLSHIGTSALTTTLANGVTYTVTTAFNSFTSRTGAITLFSSDHATNKAILNLQYAATQNVLASFTRIDSSAGQPILTFNGVITTCTNIFSYTDVQVQPQFFSRRFGKRASIYNRAKTVVY